MLTNDKLTVYLVFFLFLQQKISLSLEIITDYFYYCTAQKHKVSQDPCCARKAWCAPVHEAIFKA